jgi:hypothetical protein
MLEELYSDSSHITLNTLETNTGLRELDRGPQSDDCERRDDARSVSLIANALRLLRGCILTACVRGSSRSRYSSQMPLGRAIGVAAFMMTLVGASGLAVAQTTGSFKFDFETGSAVTLTRPQNGLIAIRLLYTNGKDKDGKLDASLPQQVRLSPSLVGTDSASLNVYVSKGECNPADPPSGPLAPFALTDIIQDLCLYAPSLPSDGKYSGNLVILSEKTEPATKAIAISRPPAAATTTLLVSGPNRVDLTLPNPFSSGSAPPFVIAVQERTEKTPVEGLFVKLEVLGSPVGYDLGKVRFRLNGLDTDLAATRPGDPLRTIAPGGQSKVEVTLNDLYAGEYNLVFRFAGSNTGTDDTQKITVPVRVHHQWFWPVLVVFIASLVSFVVNKVIVARKRRFELLGKIADLSPPWLTEFDQTPPVVWIRATLRLAERLSKRFWLTSPDEIERRVTGVSNHLVALEKAYRLRESLKKSLSPLVFRKVDRLLRPTISALGETPLNDVALQKFQSELDQFNNWLNAATLGTALWASSERSLLSLKANIDGDSNAPTEKTFTALKASLDTVLGNPPTTARTAEDAYLTFAKLQTLWDVRADQTTFDKCVLATSSITVGSTASQLDEFFNIADRYIWDRLKNNPKLEINLPVTSDPDGFQSFSPLEFSVAAPGSQDDETYLFKYRIEYNWTFTWGPQRSLTPKTLGPSVMQFFPSGGKRVSASVELMFLGDQKEVSSTKPLVIGHSRDFGRMKIFEHAELLSWAIALVLAIFSGLSIYYVSATGWGSFKDYLTLFLWGAGMETGKTFIQAAATK